MRVTTLMGSVYLIDESEQTWQRVQITPASGRCRTESGSYDAMSQPVIGEGMVLRMQPLPESEPGTLCRLIYTSDVTAIEL
jgi:hypothetical protein